MAQSLESNLLVIAEGRNSNLSPIHSTQKISLKIMSRLLKHFLVEIPELNRTEAIQVFHEKEIFAINAI